MPDKRIDEAYYGQSEPDKTWVDLFMDYLKEKKYGKTQKLKKVV